MTLQTKCNGTTRAGHPCQITAASAMLDAAGRSVAAPLRRGSPFCLFHARPFCTLPAIVEGPIVIVYLDLETTGVDVSRNRIVELAAVQGHDRAHLPGGSFSEVVHVPEQIQTSTCAQAAARVHGITDDEIARGTLFPESWARFLMFSEACLNNAILDGSDESDAEPLPPGPPDAPPSLLLIGHNSFRFDFAVILFECERHKLSTTPFRRWLFADTLHVLESAKSELGGACLKLQCMINTIASAKDLRAHRALDDCIALHCVVHSVAYKLGCSVTDLMRKFACRWDEQAGAAQIAALIDD